MSQLSQDDILHLGRLSRLRLTEEEQARFAGQLSSVVGYVEQLSEVDVSGIGPSRGISGLNTVLAADVPRATDDALAITPNHLLAGTPVHKDGFFVVRAVLGEEMISA